MPRLFVRRLSTKDIETGKNIDNKMIVDSTIPNIFVTLRIEQGD